MKTCSVDGCRRLIRARGWCIGHYNRWLKYGTPGAALLERRTGPRHHAWATDTLTYSGAHLRVKARRGKATDYACVDCGGAATSWAYDHADPNQLVDERGRAYSGDVNRYEPKCVPCHKTADLARLGATA